MRSTSKTFQVPSPITGSFSPVDGIARVSIVEESARVDPAGKRRPAVAAPINLVASRRVMLFIEDDKPAFLIANHEPNDPSPIH
ncbi:MAG TPA: hypothetical protein VKS98_09070 [Chthoniobacterales bacterium]|nr:hypothetical protein [Chthoniobacterales bacterium]